MNRRVKPRGFGKQVTCLSELSIDLQKGIVLQVVMANLACEKLESISSRFTHEQWLQIFSFEGQELIDTLPPSKS